MTERVSCKSFFKEYLIYRIKAQKTNLILCCILNALTLPLFVIAQLKGFDGSLSEFYFFGTYFPIICGIFLITLAAVGAASSFEYYSNKTLTDTIGSLPLPYRHRFWGDFISGYIANVAPVIPFALISAVFAGANSEYKEFFAKQQFSAFRFMLCMTFTLVIALTFTYLFAVLVISACGRAVKSVLFSVFGTGALAGTVTGIAGVFAVGMLGVNPAGYMFTAARFVPPFGSVIELMHGVNFLNEASFEVYNGEWWDPEMGLGGIFANSDILYILYYVILGAGLTLGAYYLGKRRRSERTGSAFAVRPMFYVISSLFSAAAVFLATVMLVDSGNSFGEKLIMAAGAGGLACIVSVVMYLPKLKRLPECILCGMLSVGFSVGAVALIKGTGSFGLAYLPENANEIEHIRVNYEYSITDKSDIKQYVKNINDILRNERDTLGYGAVYNYFIEYKTSDGRVTERSYTNSGGFSIQSMENSERSLSGYGRYFFEALFWRGSDWECHIIEDGVTYDIPEEKAAEFLDIISREAEEKYDPEAAVYARAEFSGYGPKRSFYIGNNLEKTIAFLGQIKETSEADPNTLILMIDYKPRNSGDEQSLSVKIRNKDMGNELVTELIGLLDDEFDGNGQSWNDAFTVVYNNISSSNLFKYYVSYKNSKRVLEIMTELALEALG